MCDASKNARGIYELTHAYREVASVDMLLEATAMYTGMRTSVCAAAPERACELIAELDRRRALELQHRQRAATITAMVPVARSAVSVAVDPSLILMNAVDDLTSAGG